MQVNNGKDLLDNQLNLLKEKYESEAEYLELEELKIRIKQLDLQIDFINKQKDLLKEKEIYISKNLLLYEDLDINKNISYLDNEIKKIIDKKEKLYIQYNNRQNNRNKICDNITLFHKK